MVRTAVTVLVVEDETFIGREKPFSYVVRGKSWVNNHAHVLRPLAGMSADYLNTVLAFYDFIPLTSGTTGRRKLTKAGLLSAPVVVAPLDEQQEIARRVRVAFASLDADRIQCEPLNRAGSSCHERSPRQGSSRRASPHRGRAGTRRGPRLRERRANRGTCADDRDEQRTEQERTSTDANVTFGRDNESTPSGVVLSVANVRPEVKCRVGRSRRSAVCCWVLLGGGMHVRARRRTHDACWGRSRGESRTCPLRHPLSRWERQTLPVASRLLDARRDEKAPE